MDDDEQPKPEPQQPEQGGMTDLARWIMEEIGAIIRKHDEADRQRGRDQS